MHVRQGASRWVARARSLDGDTVRGAVWATSMRALRAELPEKGLEAGVPTLPQGPWNSFRGVSIVLRLSRASCLERSLITQAWLAANSREHDVLVGVRVSPSFLAHAWVDGFDSISGEQYTVLARIDAAGVHHATG